MKKVTLLLVCVSFLACSAITGKLSGVYEAEESGLLESIEFETDGTCYVVSSLGIRSTTMAMQYEVKGNKVLIGYAGQMAPVFEIVNSNTLEGITLGYFGRYKKER
jgi:hypothetical protein